jgi:dipeptidyl aminopeptidase/acylaminoacyl peptidase
MTRWANRAYEMNGPPNAPVALFSPDGSRFVIVLKKGNILRNTITSSLVLYESSNVFTDPKPRNLATMSSSSGRDGIQLVRWINNRTIVFLGETGQLPAQIYHLDVASGRTSSITNHPTSIVAFDVSKDGREFVYEAVPANKDEGQRDRLLGNPVLISTQRPEDFLRNKNDPSQLAANRELFVMRAGRRPSAISTPDFLTEYLPLVLSPSGKHALVAVYLKEVPRNWRGYTDEFLRREITATTRPGLPSDVMQLMLLDTESRRLTPLLDAPMSGRAVMLAFAPDQHSVALSGTYLPLDVSDSRERAIRQNQTPVVEVNLRTREIQRISDHDVLVKCWKPDGSLLLQSQQAASTPIVHTYAKRGNTWRPIEGGVCSKTGNLSVDLEEDMNSPPRIFVSVPGTAKKQLLMDLNPDLSHVELAKVEALHWTATDGHEVEGGLYYPPDYRPGLRYPLVIQTHGFRKDRFQIDGPYNSAYAAMPLAARGIVVLEIGNDVRAEDANYVNTQQEAPRQMAVFEGAIDYLNKRGIVDPGRVGLLGFSRTSLYVAYTLTHSQRRFAAATLADGFDAGYMNFLLWPNEDYFALNGGSSATWTFDPWLRTSPGFNLNRVNVPVHLECYGVAGILTCWQWFSGLSLLKKPVDFVWLPMGTHLLARPSDRLASQQGTVDWFSFWLKGEKPAEKTMRDRFSYWEAMKQLQKSATPGDAGGP